MNSGAIIVAVALVAAAATAVRAQSLVEVVPEDPCVQARTFERDDDSAAAEHARRACRLQRFDDRLAAERRQQIAAAEVARTARIERWIDQTQPARVTRPFSVDALFGNGVAAYGLSLGWAFVRQAELSAWLGRRTITCDEVYLPGAGDCSRSSFGFRGRWYPFASRVTPFGSAGLTIIGSHLQIVQNGSNGGGSLLSGTGRANSYNLGGGAQIAVAWFRFSLEYVYEHAFYTGASASDPKKTPNPELNGVWSTSLNQDRHGIRVQVGYAF